MNKPERFRQLFARTSWLVRAIFFLGIFGRGWYDWHMLLKEYKKLLAEFGPQGWWPVVSTHKFEIAVGAVLTQNTAWKNVETAIANLYAAKLLTPDKILVVSEARLGELIRPAGYWQQKTKKLKILAAAWCAFTRRGRTPTRTELLGLWGVGEETADSILLYAFDVPVFVIDAYTRRWCGARGVIFKTYLEYQNYFQTNLPADYKIFQEFHALLVAWGKKVR